jgi:microcystin-dependent protein
MSNPFLGQIIVFAGTFAPLGYLACNGQLVSISENDALFNLIGTTYGGDGVQTFGLPNLNGRAPLGMGQGQGLSPYVIGQAGGQETVTLITQQLPMHTHSAATTGSAATNNVPSSLIFANAAGSTPIKPYSPPDPNNQVALSNASITQTGGSQPHDNRQPYLAVNYCIATAGVYPSQ